MGGMRQKNTTVVRASLPGSFGGFIAVALLTAMALTCWPGDAAAWWNDQWSLRKKVTIDTSPTGANVTDQIGATPVLIRLHAGNFRFGQAREDGGDLRFVAGDDVTPLKHHVEKYDSLLGEAFIWVNVPDLKPGAKTDIWLYYGDKNAPSASDVKGSYDPDTVLVYHFNERGTPPQDSSGWANHAQSAGQNVDGAIIGSGLHLDGLTPLLLPASPSLALTDGGAITWSAWVKPASLQRDAAVYSRRDGANGLIVGFDDGAPFVELDNNGSVLRSATAAPVAPGGWHHLALTATPGLVTLYLDGSAYATLNGTLPSLSSVAALGGEAAGVAPAPAPPQTTANASPPAAAAATGNGFAGDIDELAISKVARSAGFIKIASIGQGGEHEKLIVYGGDEETASWLSGYFAVILKSVTLDGWVVIGVLIFMAIVSWIVMVDKAIFVNQQAKANARFKNFFRQVASDLSLLDQGAAEDISSLGGRIALADRKVVRHSSLYRIYCIGAKETRSRFHDASAPRVLSPQSIAAIRAALDGSLIEEAQRLNRLMVLLTIAISGGPFLGLLGTVVGVMITFAAIAASGDVNVNAIAPGIAAALVATVAGLGVAIPALFGYNYLISRIKDLSADMQIFVDGFTTKIAEFYDATPVRDQRSLAAE